MSDPVTNNYGLTQPTVGGDLNVWGGVLNNAVIGVLDTILGANFAVAITTNDVTLTTSQFQSAIFIVTGALTGNRNLIIPFSPNSATVACGGRFVVVNNTTGGYNLSVITAVTASTGVVVPQGFMSFLYSDGTNVGYCSNGLPGYALASSGNPNGSLAGTAASINTNAQFAFDYVSSILYICTTTGDATGAVWTNVVAGSAPLPVPQGYLTPTSGTPIIPGDAASATAIYYTPYQGDWTVIHNGSILIAYRFSELPLTLTTSQAANNIYDVFLAWNNGSPVIGTGPSWASSGGSVTAGSCARGSGGGSTQLVRSGGVYVNANSMSLIYNTGSGNSTITVAANQGVYLGSLFMDSTAGQVSCYRSYGQSRKWGIWNAYNRVPIILQAGDSTVSWTYDSSNYRQSDGSAGNQATVFCGLAEEFVTVKFTQQINTSSGVAYQGFIAIGWNSTSTVSGTAAQIGTASALQLFGTPQAVYTAPPSIGINNVVCLEKIASNIGTFNGTQACMVLSAAYRG